MAGTKTKKHFSSFAVAMVLLGILVMVNLFSQRHFMRLDLTDEKQFTLSGASIDAVKELEDTLLITVYVSKDLPSHLATLKRGVTDLLEDYRSYSRGKVKIRFVDPGDDEELKRNIARIGIQEAMWRVIQKDKVETVKGYFGIAIKYEGREEGIPVVNRLDTFEYDLTATLLKISTSEVKMVGFLGGHNEYDPFVELNSLRSSLEKQYQVIDVDLDRTDMVPDGVDTLIIARPENIPPRHAYLIDQFLVAGGRVVMLQDPIKLKKGRLEAEPVDSGINEMLASYGVSYQNSLVVDQYNFNTAFNMGNGMVMNMPYPFWVKVFKKNMDAGNPALDKIDNLLFPWTGSLRVEEENLGEKKASVLMSSSDSSWIQTSWDLNPRQRFMPQQSELRTHPLAVLVSGRFTSFYKAKEIPQKPADNSSAVSSAPVPPQNETIVDGTEDAALLVISDALFITEDFARRSPAGLAFVLNSIDQMTFGDKLISLRARGLTQRTIDQEMPESKKALIKYSNTFVLPALIVLLAIIRAIFVRRRKSGRTA
ncbi:MAG TPA: Gldg family protein [bacterium]|nr:Gldg family protein [bacterium]